MEQRLKSLPARQSESEVSCKKKGGGPCAFVTPDFFVSSEEATDNKERIAHKEFPFHILFYMKNARGEINQF